MKRLLTRLTQFAISGSLTALLAVCLLFSLASGQSTNKPISKNGLTRALQIGGLSQKELVEQVTHRGVDFTMTPEIESDLTHAGANTSLLQAVRENYRPGATSNTTASQPESNRALAALDAPEPAASSASPQGEPTPHSSPANANSANSKRPLTLRDIHKLYIEKMPNGLDGYLRAAISRKLGSYFSIVLERPEADAILQSTSPNALGAVSIIDPAGKVVYWSGSATDKEKVYLNFKHGGQREVAEKLAGQLKKSLDQ
jgi:hypothetical protein